MFLVQMTVLEDGERLPLLWRANPYQPVVVPLLYVAIRRRYQKSRTLLRDVRALRWLYDWCEGVRRERIDLDIHLTRGEMLCASDIEAFARWLRVDRPNQASPGTGSKVVALPRVLKPSSLSNYLVAVRTFLRWAAQRYRPERGRYAKAEALQAQTLLINETFDAVRIRGKTPELGKGLEPEQTAYLLKVADPHHRDNPFRRRLRQRNALIVKLFHETGIRRGELLKLKVEDLFKDDDENCFISVTRRPDDSTDPRTTEPGQKTDDRVLAVHPSLYDALLCYIREERRPKRQGRAVKLPHSFLFVSERGAPLAESEINYLLAQLAKRCFGETLKVHPHLLQ
jgi:integrase